MILKLGIRVVAGGGLGFACLKFVGGSCGAGPLTGHPVSSTIYGAVIGAIHDQRRSLNPQPNSP